MSRQLDIFGDPPPPRRSAYRETSREAYRSVPPSLDSRILDAIRRAGPITCEAIENRIGANHQSVSGNLRHLVERGLVKDSGEKGKTASGRKAIKWVLA